MNWWTIYLWTRLDGISNTLDVFTVLLCLAWIGNLIGYGIGTIEDIDELKGWSKKTIKKVSCSFFIVLTLSILVPNSKDFAMMYVIPKVADSKVIQKDLPDLYNLAMEAFKTKIEKSLKGGEEK